MSVIFTSDKITLRTHGKIMTMFYYPNLAILLMRYKVHDSVPTYTILTWYLLAYLIDYGRLYVFIFYGTPTLTHYDR